MDYTLEDMAVDEAKAITEELQGVLAKYNAEMSVTSNINIMKRVPMKSPDGSVLSPIQPNGTDQGNTPSTTA